MKALFQEQHLVGGCFSWCGEPVVIDTTRHIRSPVVLSVPDERIAGFFGYTVEEGSDLLASDIVDLEPDSLSD